jgi:uncharacterized protein (DUF4415 family)
MTVRKRVSRSGSKKAKDLRIGRSSSGDAAELDADWFEKADEYRGTKLVRRGRPPGTSSKTQMTIRVSNDVLEFFRASGPGWQTRMDEALRRYVESQRR